ncbi:MAG: BtpA/SgcQ family protein [Anaerolineae bacterium]|nr:BtpA/SgcQ family protein [Phycisphaerae bacterium]
MNALLAEWKNTRTPVIGMLHLLPLPGSPLFDGNANRIRDSLLRDADSLAEGGVDGLMIENFGDVPFFPGRAPSHVVAQITALAALVRQRVPNIPLGINVLRNDGQSALAIAHAVGASYIRVNVLCGARVTDQGVIQGTAHDLLRERAMLDPKRSIKIFADVDVKHSAPLARRDLADEVDDTLERGLADALIVSGAGTGKATDPSQVASVKKSAGDAPVFIGSGVSVNTISSYLPHCDGVIVGTSLKRDGVASNEVDVTRVRELMKRARG